MALAYLFEPTTQFQARTGANLTAGFLRVFYTQTDDAAPTYCDFAGTLNEEDIVLDADGRAVVIVDDEKTYRLEVYNRNHGLLFTIDPLSAIGGAGGAGQVVTVESTDGSVDVTKTVVGSNTYFDLSTTVVMDEPLDWIKASVSNISDGQVIPAHDEGTMYTTVDGIAVVAGRFYHTTTWLDIVPSGNGINYETVSVSMRLNGTALWTREFDIDNSVNDPVPLEVSYDFDCQADGYVDFEVAGVSSFSSANLSTQFHRIYNGYSSEYAKKAWVGNYFVQNSSLNVESGTITGISGTPIGGIAEATVSAIASSYAESAASSKLDSSAFASYTASALTGIQQDTATISSAVSSLETSKVDQSAFDACCSAVGAQVSALSSDVSAIRQDTADISAAVSAVTSQTGNYIPWSASGEFQPSGNYVSSDVFTAYTASALTGIQQDTADISAAVSGLTGTYVQYADLESASGKITGISGTALWGGHEYTGVWPVVVDNTADTISAANKPLCVDETMTGYESAGSAVIGVNTSTVLSGLTAYQPASAMTAYQPSGDYYSASNPSGFITGVDLSDYATTAYVDSSVSGKLDTTAFNSGDFYSTSNPSGFITGVDLSDYATTGYVDSSVSGKADSSALTAYQPVSAMTGYQPSGDYYSASNPSGFITGVDLSDYATTGYVDSSVSGKQDASAMTAYQLSGDYYSASNPSGFITGVDLSDYATTGYVDSSVSGKLDASASGDFYSTSNPSGFITGVDLSNYATTGYVDSSVSGKADSSALTAYQEITGMSAYIPTSESANYQQASAMTAYQPAGDYQPSGDYLSATESSNYLLTSQSSMFQPSGDYAYNSSLADYQLVSAMTAYQLSGDYAYNSSLSGYIPTSESSNYITSLAGYATEEYVESSVSGKQDVSGMTAYIPTSESGNYQLTADMTAYQPSGDYIYASSLGTGVI